MKTFHFESKHAALGLGLLGFLGALHFLSQGAPRQAVAAPPSPPSPTAEPPKVMAPPPAAPLPETANKRHLRYAARDAESPR